MDLENCSVLVTGGLGFIGTSLESGGLSTCPDLICASALGLHGGRANRYAACERFIRTASNMIVVSIFCLPLQFDQELILVARLIRRTVPIEFNDLPDSLRI
eukprot:scaffold519827_cov50-Prasinocladus_malaysianus.AAC.1